MSDDRIDSIRAEFMRECAVNGWKAFMYLDTKEILAEIATLRAKLEVCTAFAEVYAEKPRLRDGEPLPEFWDRWRSAQTAFLAACGITPTPDDTSEEA